jgi:3-hydroxyacyl-CoA dehydrogenase
MGPFEIWQAAGWHPVATLIAEDIAVERTMTNAPLPDWVLAPDRQGVHGADGSWSAEERRSVPRSTHPVYARQLFPERIMGEPEPSSETVFETDAVRMWHSGDDLAIVSFKTKMHTIGLGVLDGVLEALERAEHDFKALVIWHPTAPFSAGANLMEAMDAWQAGQFDLVTEMVLKFQQTSLALRHSNVPTVAAAQGLVLGGGCEFLLHCDRTVAALESYIGLVEVGVGLIPGAGGCKEMALRASDDTNGGDVFPHVARYFERIGMGKVATSALEAREWGYLRSADKVVLHSHELLHVAKKEAEALFEAGYRPPQRRSDVRVAGDAGIATIRTQLVNMLEGGFISEHDYFIGQRLARVMCGGEVDPGSEVSEDWLLALEIQTFMGLAQMPKSQERIFHMLQHGKPLRN